MHSNRSIALDIPIDPSHKCGAARRAQCAAKDKKTEAEDGHVAEVEARLQEARHVGTGKEIIDRVAKHIPSAGARRDKRRPLPAPVFCIEKKIRDNIVHMW